MVFQNDFKEIFDQFFETIDSFDVLDSSWLNKLCQSYVKWELLLKDVDERGEMNGLEDFAVILVN